MIAFSMSKSSKALLFALGKVFLHHKLLANIGSIGDLNQEGRKILRLENGIFERSFEI